ncbi:SRPBCC family protein [Microlunatus speluncae]|uniref:SRPBCC family protein n=1 Tax=Microlunatus speluncae TaxID=2594267 RepID=UPI0012666543|nr:SRPBCC family protein [Microlunatus speluncae]
MPLLLTASVTVKVPVATAWRAVIDWPGQSRWIPFTTVTAVPSPERPDTDEGIGVRVEALSGIRLGPLRIGLLDRFVVTGWTAPSEHGPDGTGPHEVEVLHLGPGFTGVGTIRVLSAAGGSIIAVTESFLPPGGAPAAIIVRPLLPVLRAGLTFSLRRLAALLERGER